ncbi:MAG: phage baseplate protein [Lachnospiraceae bacterium]|nr:phage baseplate protein [Lachnospiraceae bacterium]
MIRKFWLTNSKNETKQLQSASIFLNEPQGMGFSNALGTVQYGEKLTYESAQNFEAVSGTVIFKDSSLADKYSKYHDFVTFLTYTPLTLHYQIPTSTPAEYTMDVAVNNLGKTEVKSDGLLQCDISLQCLGRWQGAEITKTGTSTSYSLTNDSHFPVGFTIKLTGSGMENPYFTLTNDSGLYGEAKFLGTFDKVTVNSKDSEQEVIVEVGGSVLPNPLSYQDLSISNGSIYVTFIKIARGTSTLAIGLDSGTLTGVEVKYVPLYRSV